MGIEQALFDGTAYDGDLNHIQFIDVTLRIPMGSFPVGATFSSAILDWEKCEVLLTEFYDTNSGKCRYHTFPICLQLGKNQL